MRHPLRSGSRRVGRRPNALADAIRGVPTPVARRRPQPGRRIARPGTPEPKVLQTAAQWIPHNGVLTDAPRIECAELRRGRGAGREVRARGPHEVPGARGPAAGAGRRCEEPGARRGGGPSGAGEGTARSRRSEAGPPSLRGKLNLAHRTNVHCSAVFVARHLDNAVAKRRRRSASSFRGPETRDPLADPDRHMRQLPCIPPFGVVGQMRPIAGNVEVPLI